MGTVTIQRFTYKNPISMIGEEAGVCWGADTSDPEKKLQTRLGLLGKRARQNVSVPGCLYDPGRLFCQSDP